MKLPRPHRALIDTTIIMVIVIMDITTGVIRVLLRQVVVMPLAAPTIFTAVMPISTWTLGHLPQVITDVSLKLAFISTFQTRR